MNLWRAFDQLFDKSLPQIGEVVSVSGTRCVVTLLPGTAQITVSGVGRSLEVGQRWIVQDGTIIEEGPTGTVVNIEV